MIGMSLSENLKRARKEKGKSQTELARASGVQQQLISQIESGKNTSTKFLPQLAKALGVSINELDPSYQVSPDIISTEEQIVEMLRKIEGLSDRGVELALMAITTSLQANRGTKSEHNASGDLFEKPIPRHESSSSR